MKAYARIAGTVLGALVLLGGGFVSEALAQTVLLQEAGALEDGDMVLPSDNSLYDEYTVEGEEGQTVTVTMVGDGFVPYLAILDPQNPNNFVLGEGGIMPDSFTASLQVTLPRGGAFLVIANGLDGSSMGDYTIEAVAE